MQCQYGYADSILPERGSDIALCRPTWPLGWLSPKGLDPQKAAHRFARPKVSAWHTSTLGFPETKFQGILLESIRPYKQGA
jgi:hypothetical protein